MGVALPAGPAVPHNLKACSTTVASQVCISHGFAPHGTGSPTSLSHLSHVDTERASCHAVKAPCSVRLSGCPFCYCCSCCFCSYTYTPSPAPTCEPTCSPPF